MSERSSKLATAVVDTNLCVRGLISRRGGAFALLEALRQEHFTLLISEELQREYADVLARPRLVIRYGLTSMEVNNFFSLIPDRTLWVTPVPLLPVEVRDVKDEMVLAAALGGEADFLVTSDEDLLVLRDDPRLGSLQIVTVGEFLAALRE